jgi:hypothetical protein
MRAEALRYRVFCTSSSPDPRRPTTTTAAPGELVEAAVATFTNLKAIQC